jgi:hypothetical protein
MLALFIAFGAQRQRGYLGFARGAEHWSAIVRVAEALIERGEVTSEDIDRLMRACLRG